MPFVKVAICFIIRQIKCASALTCFLYETGPMRRLLGRVQIQ
jgi:hypothetical protein